MIIDCLVKAIFLYFIYNVVALMSFGIPQSLSMTYYHFRDQKDSLKSLFPAMMTMLTIFIMPCWIVLSEGSDFQFMSFLSAAGVLFVGAAPAFKSSSLENGVHLGSALVCAFFALAWIVCVTPYWWVILIVLAVFAVIAVLTKTVKSAYTYWLEHVAFVSTFIAMLMYYENIYKFII